MEHIKRLKRELAYEGSILKIYKDTMLIEEDHEAVWDFIHHKGAAAVLAVNKDGEILMVRQYRPATESMMLELPAGVVDYEGEDKADCARRELEEETGYLAEHIEWLVRVNTTVAFCDEVVEVYYATGLTPTAQRLDDGEYIELCSFKLEELIAMIFTGEITDAKTIAGLLAYKEKYGLSQPISGV